MKIRSNVMSKDTIALSAIAAKELCIQVDDDHRVIFTPGNVIVAYFRSEVISQSFDCSWEELARIVDFTKRHAAFLEVTF